MSGCVIDASALVAALADEGATGYWAEELVLEYDLVAPELIFAETTNVLRRLEAIGSLGGELATQAVESLMRLDLHIYGFTPFSKRIWAMRSNLTVYDAWYVAVAESLDLPLATLDQKLARSSAAGCEFLLPGRR